MMKGAPVINMMGIGGGRLSACRFLCSSPSGIPLQLASGYTTVNAVSALIVLLDGVDAHWLGGEWSR